MGTTATRILEDRATEGALEDAEDVWQLTGSVKSFASSFAYRFVKRSKEANLPFVIDDASQTLTPRRQISIH